MIEDEKKKIILNVRNILDEYPRAGYSDMAFENEIEKLVMQQVGKQYCSAIEKAEMVRQVFSAYRGLDILDSILSDATITEVMINGPDKIFVEKSGRVRRIDAHFEDEKRLADIIQRIVAKAGRELSRSSPIVDTRLEDGSRVNIVLPPISLVGPVVTIRKFSKTPMTIEKLIEYGSITQEIADVLKVLVESRYNIFVCGGTGSGKTTFLNALSNYIPADERVITIEDSAELQITHVDNLISMETRNSNSSGEGEIVIKELIKSSLRMRPDRIIVGEVRGEEALDMLQAMNTGHDGSLSTGHANSTKDMLSRLESMVLQGASGMPLPAIRSQISSALDIIIHLSRLRDHSRKTMEITEVLELVNGEYRLNPLYVFEEDEFSSEEKVSGKLVRTKNPLHNVLKLQLAGKKITI